MRHSDITCPYKGTLTHPYVATVPIDPSDAARFQRMADDQTDVHILGVDRGSPDSWTIFVACASRDGRDKLESSW